MRASPLVRTLSLLLATSSLTTAQTCLQNGATKVCVSWGAGGNPVQGVDFTALATATTFSIVLHTGDSGWDIVSTNSATGQPGDLGDVAIVPITPFEKFGLSIGDGTAPGARDVGRIDLTASSWSGSSSLNGGWLAGSLSGGLRLRADSAGGAGAVQRAFTVNGKTGGQVAVTSVLAPFRLEGAVSADGKIGRITAPTVFGTLHGNLVVGSISDITSVDGIRGSLDVASLDSTWLTVGRSIAAGAKLIVRDLKGTSEVECNDFGTTETIAGYVGIYGGVDAQQRVDFWMPLASTGVLDLAGGDVAGVIEFVEGGSGTLENGGIVRSSAHIWLSETQAYTFSGVATFASLEAFSVVEAEDSTIDGIVKVQGDCDGQLVVRYGDLLANGQFLVGGKLGSNGWIGPIGPPGVVGDLYGTIEIAGDAHGLIAVDNAMRSGSQVVVGGALAGALRIGGALDFGAQVQLRHLDAGGRVYVNDSQGPNDADGFVYVGPLNSTAILPVVFDGCIRVRKSPTAGHGDLNGAILVRGCHATPDDLDICIDGAVNGGVTLLQTGCLNQVTWSCLGACQ